MKHHRHVSKTASACFYHIRRLRQIRHLVSREVLTQLVASFVLSRLDYCNAVLAGLSASTLAPLQHAQNALRLLDRRSRITALKKLHWLPVKYRVTFNIATIIHQTFHHRCPSYLSDLVVFAPADSNVYANFAPPLLEPLPSNEAGRSSEGAPSRWPAPTWNSLPATICTIDSHSLSLPSSCPQDTLFCSAFDNILVFTLTLTL